MDQTPEPQPAQRAPDLADHFMECGKLNRFLTVYDDRRFVITDDFTGQRTVRPVAAAAAAVFSKDPLVAQAALVPILRGADPIRDRLDELFDLIEAQAFATLVKTTAREVHARGFRPEDLAAVEQALGATLSPARKRYREFLLIIRRLAANEMSGSAFRDEFLDFTYKVAGKLDFGIYSFCIDRLFASDQIPIPVKGAIATEILRFPPLIRKELITNITTSPTRDAQVVQFIHQTMREYLDAGTLAEIGLLEALKVSRNNINARVA
ncbi:MAG: hypothetical protein ACPGO3_03230 [Magnetospiraceae bacterium]